MHRHKFIVSWTISAHEYKHTHTRSLTPLCLIWQWCVNGMAERIAMFVAEAKKKISDKHNTYDRKLRLNVRSTCIAYHLTHPRSTAPTTILFVLSAGEIHLYLFILAVKFQFRIQFTFCYGNYGLIASCARSIETSSRHWQKGINRVFSWRIYWLVGRATMKHPWSYAFWQSSMKWMSSRKYAHTHTHKERIGLASNKIQVNSNSHSIFALSNTENHKSCHQKIFNLILWKKERKRFQYNIIKISK